MRTKIQANHPASEIVASLVCTIGAKQTCIGKDFAESIWLPKHIFALRISIDGSMTVSGCKCSFRVQDYNRRNATHFRTFRRPQSCAPTGLSTSRSPNISSLLFGEGQSQPWHYSTKVFSSLSPEMPQTPRQQIVLVQLADFVAGTGGKVDTNAH